MPQKAARRAVIPALLICATTLAAQSTSPTYPHPRKGDVVDDYHGTKVADPYRWMEDLNAPEVKQWVDAENAITLKYLDGLPQRDSVEEAHHELWNYPKVTRRATKGATGSTTATAACSGSPLSSRARRSADRRPWRWIPTVFRRTARPRCPALCRHPTRNTLPTGNRGGSDWSTYYVRELGTGKQLPDVIRWVKFSSLSWTEDGKGFSTDAIPNRVPARPRDAVVDKKIYYHTSARRSRPIG